MQAAQYPASVHGSQDTLLPNILCMGIPKFHESSLRGRVHAMPQPHSKSARILPNPIALELPIYFPHDQAVHPQTILLPFQ